MKKIALLAPGDLRLIDTDQKMTTGNGMVKVHVTACGICGSDLALYAGKRDLKKERYFGHEFSGIVTEAGEGSRDFGVGMRVASELSRSCGRCWYCRNGMPEYCRSMNDAFLPGGFTEETLVAAQDDFSFLSKIPDTIDDITASLLEPMNCAYHIAMKASLKPGDDVAVFGLGAMGMIAAIVLKRLGARNLIAVDKSPLRLAKAEKTGIFTAAVSNDAEGKQIIKDICGDRGVDAAIEVTGAAPVLQDAIEVVRYGGRVVVGSVYSSHIADFDPLPIFRKELTMAGAKGPTMYRNSDGSSTIFTMMDLLQEDLKKIITVYDYKDALQAFADARSGEAIKAVIKF